MSNYTSFVTDLQTQIWRTAGARFAASRRLALREKLAMYSIAGLSIVGLMLGIFALAPGATASIRVSEFSATLGIAVSLLVLIISLLEAAGRHAVNADLLHRHSVGLKEIQRAVAALLAQHPNESEDAWQLASRLQSSYETLIRECPVNHEPIDSLRFAVQHRHAPEFQSAKLTGFFGAPKAFIVLLRYSLTFAWLPIFSAIVVFVLWVAMPEC